MAYASAERSGQAGVTSDVVPGLPAELLAYDFGLRKPYDVQLKTMAVMLAHPRGYNLNGLGTGKTFCALTAYDILRQQGKVRKLLVVAPLSTLRFVWASEIIKAFPHLTCEIVYGTKDKRIAALRRDADVYVVNHDGVATILDELAYHPDIDALAIDELAVYRNGAAKRTRTMRELAKNKKWVWGLTGSPMPRSVCDIWGQCSIVTPTSVPKYFTHLRHQLCFKQGPFKWEARPGAVEQAVAHMQPSVRYSLDDVLELPSVVTQYAEIAMGTRQAQIYRAMKNQAVALVNGNKIDALNAGAVMSKLLQIALGWVYTREGNTVQLDNDERIQAILDYIDSTPRKALVFLPFKHALEGVSAALKKEGIRHFKVSGDTPSKERNEVFNAFQNGPGRYPLIAHPACLAHGVTLTAADTIIWGGPITSLETFQQANARIRRIGQRNKQLIVMLGGTQVEKKVYTLLSSNDVTQIQFLDLLAKETDQLL